MRYLRLQRTTPCRFISMAVRRLPAITGVSNRIRSAVLIGRRSRLYLWMVANFDQFSVILAEAGRPNWQALLEAFRDERLVDKGMTAEKIRLTWSAVRTAVAKDRDLPAKVQALSAKEQPAGLLARPVTPTEDQPKLLALGLAVPRQAAGPGASPRPAYNFRPATLKPRKEED